MSPTSPAASELSSPLSTLADGSPRRLDPKRATAIAYVASMFMSAMDSHIVNVMIPTLSRSFHSPLAAVQWTAIGYVLSLAVFIPASSWLGDRFGTKRIFIVALVLFIAASAACGQARNLPELVLSRVVQGAGGGMLSPVATSMLYRAYPPAERARMTRLLVVPILLGPILAQPIGGLLVTKASWRWAFYLNIPVGLATLALVTRGLVEHRQSAGRRFDATGFVLSAAGLASLLYAISEGALSGWSSPGVIASAVAGLGALVAFVLVEPRRREPLLNLSLFSDRLFAATNAVAALNTAAFSGLLYLAPVFLQEARGLSALDAGLTSFATAFGVMCASQSVGRFYSRIGPRRMAALGQLGLAAALCTFLLVGPGTNLWWVRGVLFLAGSANSATMIAIQTSMFARITSANTGFGAAIFNASRQSSTALGIAVFTTIISEVAGSKLHAFHVTFVAAAGFALAAGLAAALLIRDEDARATMTQTSAPPARSHR